uniref:Uncharacterized protein n=1 Tax=Gruberia lanceolata TaxID=1978530 RepID=A0A6C0UCJ8_9CILI|nr:hypothetical protein [Gruberia lanceolata]
MYKPLLDFDMYDYPELYAYPDSLMIDYKKAIYFSYDKKNNKKHPIRVSIRKYYFFRLIDFLKTSNVNIPTALRIFYNNYYYLWLTFIETYEFEYYYLLLKKILAYERYLRLNNSKIKLRYNNYYTLDSFLLYNNIKSTISLVDYTNLTSFMAYLDLSDCLFNFDNSFSIHFIRTQRRYNKRRYSKIRAISRPSFFSGIALSSIIILSFWNGTIKGVDWGITTLVVIDINFVLFSLLLYSLFRLYKVYYFNVSLRKRGRVKVINALNRFYIIEVIRDLLK